MKINLSKHFPEYTTEQIKSAASWVDDHCGALPMEGFIRLVGYVLKRRSQSVDAAEDVPSILCLTPEQPFNPFPEPLPVSKPRQEMAAAAAQRIRGIVSHDGTIRERPIRAQGESEIGEVRLAAAITEELLDKADRPQGRVPYRVIEDAEVCHDSPRQDFQPILSNRAIMNRLVGPWDGEGWDEGMDSETRRQRLQLLEHMSVEDGSYHLRAKPLVTAMFGPANGPDASQVAEGETITDGEGKRWTKVHGRLVPDHLVQATLSSIHLERD